jgi:hypothetical protein
MTASRQRAAILRALTDDRLGLRIAQVHRGYTLLVDALDLARDDPEPYALESPPCRCSGPRRPQRSSVADCAGVA